VPVGATVVGVRFRRGDDGGDATLVVDGETCGQLHVPFVMRMISSTGASVGLDHGSQVSRRYTGAFPFEGQLERIDIELRSPRPAHHHEDAETDARSTMARQ
jgi:arylsulfatase